MTVTRLAEEFGFEVVVQHGTEAYKVAAELAKRHIPVSLTIPDSPGGKAELTSGHESYVPKTRVTLFEAAIAMANGLGMDRAIKAITLDAARILKIDADFGSLEPGKVADVVLFDGDPFEYTTHVTHVILGGRLVYDRAAEAKHPSPRRGLGSSGAGEPGCCMGY